MDRAVLNKVAPSFMTCVILNKFTQSFGTYATLLSVMGFAFPSFWIATPVHFPTCVVIMDLPSPMVTSNEAFFKSLNPSRLFVM